AGAGATDISAALSPGTKVRVTLQVEGGSSTTGHVIAKVYAGTGSWTTQIGETFESSAFNTGTEQVGGIDLGAINALPGVYTIGWDDIQFNDGAGPEIGDIVEALPSPIISVTSVQTP